jgi:hypothetical protein
VRQAKSGQRVMAGQAEPKAEYSCQKLAQEKQEWGPKGNMDLLPLREPAGLSEPTTESLLRQERTAG